MNQASPTSLPPLVLLGDPDLMRAQPAVSREQIGTRAFTQALRTLARCMDHYGGIGIAAPQVGWSARVFCLGIAGASARYPGAEAIPFGFWINPEIVTASDQSNWAWEGCLSVPGMRGWVERPAAIEVVGLDERGERQAQRYEGFAARVFQHEFDHLDGVLYPARVTEPRWLLPDAVMARQDHWADDWPSPGARATTGGVLSDRP